MTSHSLKNLNCKNKLGKRKFKEDVAKFAKAVTENLTNRFPNSEISCTNIRLQTVQTVTVQCMGSMNFGYTLVNIHFL